MASLTLRQMETEAALDTSESASIVSAEEPQFDNIFAEKQFEAKPEPSQKQHKHQHRDSLPNHTLPQNAVSYF